MSSVNLPQELLINILLRLPPKLLIQFRCVSKSWNSLISSPYFVSLQTQQAMISRAKNIKERERMIMRKLGYSPAQNSEIFSLHVDDGHFTLLEDIKIEDPFQDKVRYYNRIVGACNGVFCLSDDFLGSVVLWNPVIKRKVIIPWSRANSSGGNESLIFALGFGFDARRNEYKVVKIAYARKGDVVVPPEAEVYALSTGKWRKINGNIPRDCIVEHLWPQVFVHGNVHWTAYRRIGGEHGRVENLVMVFDIEHEVFGEMLLPDTLKNESPLRLNVTAFEQSLAVVHCHGRGLGLKSFSIWVMKNYGDKESWNKLYIPDPYDIGIWSTYKCGADGGALFASRNGGLYSYHPVTWQRHRMSSTTLKRFYTGPYVDSLALLYEGTEAQVSMEGETGVCESLSRSFGDGVRTVEYIEFWMMFPARV